MSFPVQFYLLTTKLRAGVKDNRPWEIHTATGIVQMTDKDGNVSDEVVEVRLPKDAPKTLPRGMYTLNVEPYQTREKELGFAIRSIVGEPVKAASK